MSECSLFQVKITDEQINQWFPLECSVDNPQNCGPTALSLTNVIPRKRAQEVSKYVESTGINLIDFTRLMLDYMPRYDITLVLEQPIESIVDLIKTKLFPGNITIIGISTGLLQNTDTFHSRHITTLAKNSSGDVMLFDGQTQQTYINEQIDTYLMHYTTFYYWCTEIKLKRNFSDILSIIRKPHPETEGPLKKKSRIIGGKSKKIYKKCRKYKKTKRNKYSRKIYK